MTIDELKFDISTECGDEDATNFFQPGSNRLPPLKAIRRHCLDCAGSSNEVAACVATRCPLWLYRLGKKPSREAIDQVSEIATYPIDTLPITQGELHAYTPLRAIRRRCLDCSGGSVPEIRRCHFDPDAKQRCDLHGHRMRLGSKRKPASATDLARLRSLREANSG